MPYDTPFTTMGLSTVRLLLVPFSRVCVCEMYDDNTDIGDTVSERADLTAELGSDATSR